MLAYIKGKLLHKTHNYLIVERDGLGYKIFATPELFELPTGSEAEMYLYHKTSDDGEQLYGLSTIESLELFELLLTVNGVGPKSALGILSSGKPEYLKQAIASGDASIFTRISGVGSKTAERIILELKNKIGTLGAINGSTSDIFDALLALGYSQKEVRDAVTKLDSNLPTETQIKQALKLLSH